MPCSTVTFRFGPQTNNNMILMSLTGVWILRAAFSFQFAFELVACNWLNNKACVYFSGLWNATGLHSGAETQDVNDPPCLCLASDAVFRQLLDSVRLLILLAEMISLMVLHTSPQVISAAGRHLSENTPEWIYISHIFPAKSSWFILVFYSVNCHLVLFFLCFFSLHICCFWIVNAVNVVIKI